MDIWTVLKACARRWYVFLPILGIALWIGNARVEAMPPVYTAESSAALTGPALIPGDEAGEIIEVNPFQSLGGSLNTTTQILVSVMDSGPKRDQFVEQGITLDYEVTQDDAVIYFYVEGDDPVEVAETSARLVELLDVEVATLQTKPVEAPESRIRAVPLTLPVAGERDTTAGLQLLAVIGVLGLLLAAGAAVLADGLVRLRARRTEQRRTDAVEATAWVEPPARHATGPAAPAEIGPGDRQYDDSVATQQLALGDLTPDPTPELTPDPTAGQTAGQTAGPTAMPTAVEAPGQGDGGYQGADGRADERFDDAASADPSAPVPAPAGRHGLPA